MDSSSAHSHGSATFSAPDRATLLKAKQRQIITRLFKGYLCLLDEITRDHDEAMDKLEGALPDQFKGYVTLADYLSEARTDGNRRKVLGAGNDAVRELDELIDSLRISEQDHPRNG